MSSSSVRTFIIVASISVVLLILLVAGLATCLIHDNTAPSAGGVTVQPSMFPTTDTGASRVALVSDTSREVPQVPSIVVQPSNATVLAGQTAKFEVKAVGTPPLSYQWQRNSTNLSGATEVSYITPEMSMAESGFTYSVVVSNSAGSVTSHLVTLSINLPKPALAAPSSAACYDTFDVSWTGVVDVNQWDLIMMYRVGDSDADSVSHTYVKSGDSAGSMPFTAPPKPGKYEFRYFPYGSQTKLMTSNVITITDDKAQTASAP